MTGGPLRLGRRAFAVTLTTSVIGNALGRIPYDGVLRLQVPWPTYELDPHALDDPAALWFAHAVADPLYALDSSGRAYPTLAVDLPQQRAGATSIRLRRGLRTARGRSLTARDAAWSIDRARRFGASGLLAPFGRPKPARSDPHVLEFPATGAADLARALASPVTAILPRAFSSAHPDGTGAFHAQASLARLRLTRNPNAARGAAFLDEVRISPAAQLGDSLRAFETASSDVGWLGAGLHRRRQDAVPFRGPIVGWVVLRTGQAAGRWGAPGIAQQLADALPSSRLGHLGLPGRAANRSRPAWQGAPSELLVRVDFPYLVEVANVCVASLATAGHEITVRTLPASRLAGKKRSRDYALMVDIVRSIGPRPEDTLLALLMADDPRLATHAPRLATRRATEMTSSLRLGVIGALRPQGAHAPEFRGLAAWDLAAAWRVSKPGA